MNFRILAKRLLTIVFVLLSFAVVNSQTYNSNADAYNDGYGQVYQSFGVAQATINMQNNTNLQIQRLIMQQAMENRFGKKAVEDVQSSKTKNSVTNSQPVSTKNNAVFKPISQLDCFKIIAETIGTNAEEKNALKQIFAATKTGVESDFTSDGKKNNLAAAMTFLMVSTITVYNDAPEPSEKAVENLFLALNLMFDEMPEMANVPNKDKQFLYDTYIAFGGLALATYTQAKDKNDKELLGQAKEIAGALLLDVIKLDPKTIRFKGDLWKIDSAGVADQTLSQIKNKVIEKPSETVANITGITKNTTNFDDGWVAIPESDWVQVQRDGTEVRLYYINKRFDDSRGNTVQPNEHYWNMAVAPYLNFSNSERWSGVEYPVIYFIQGDAVDKKTGKRCFVAMKVVFEGGARVVVAVAPDRPTYEQQFSHPNDLNKMLGYNRFGVAPQDLVGTWAGGGSSGVEYYSAYSGTYTGMSAVSTSDEVVFNANGNYQSTHSSANMNNSGTQFAKLQYSGKATVNHWELNATNRVSGKTKKFWCRLEAVRCGYLLILTDSDYESLIYTLFKKR